MINNLGDLGLITCKDDYKKKEHKSTKNQIHLILSCQRKETKTSGKSFRSNQKKENRKK